MSAPIPISSQASAVELALRETRLDTRSNRMRPNERALQIARLEAAARTLRWLESNEATVKAKVDSAGGEALS